MYTIPPYMNKLVAGKASIVTLFATVVVSSFLLGKSFSGAFAQGQPESITICHATNSDVNPYNTESPNIQNDGSLTGGHLNDTGPIWNSTLKDLKIQWGDIIPAYTSGSFSYPGLNNTTEGLAILANDCNIPETPVERTPVCSDDSYDNYGGEDSVFDPETEVADDSLCSNTPVDEPTPTDDGDVCDNIDGIQTGVPEGLHIDASGRNCVAFSNSNPPENNSTPQGQVLGATAMASTGSFAETLYQVVMGLGGLLTVKGVKNFKKASKRS